MNLLYNPMHVIIYVLPLYASPWFIEILIKVTLVGAFSHVPTHVYLHVSVYMASSQLGYVSLLSSLFGQPSRHLETSYSDHLCHWTSHTSLIAPNHLGCVRIWLSDIGMTDGTLPILTSTSTEGMTSCIMTHRLTQPPTVLQLWRLPCHYYVVITARVSSALLCPPPLGTIKTLLKQNKRRTLWIILPILSL